MNKSIVYKIAAGILVLAILTLALALFAKPPVKSGTVFSIDTTHQPTEGNPAAKVHIVAFEDLKCIACKNFNNTVLPSIRKEYVEPGVAQYTVINLAFIPGSMPAANAARCLYTQNPAWFFTFVDNIYRNQPPENEDWATIPKLMAFAAVIPDVDKDKLSRCIYESPYNDFIQNNFKQASRLQGESVSTPAIYVNGRFIDPPTLKNLEQAINAAK
jgi:protein-disulfide isomerase